LTPDDPPVGALIRASEITQWAYCQRAWWLAGQGYENRNTAALQAGTSAHERHGRTVAGSARTHVVALALLIVGLLLLVAALLTLL